MTSISRFAGAAIALGALVALAPSPGAAQQKGQIILTPYAAVYAPTTDLASAAATDAGTTASLSFKHKTGFAVGANLSYWFTEQWALEGGGTYGWTDASASAAVFGGGTNSAGTRSRSAYVAMGALKAMYNLVPQPASWNLRLGAGPAVIYHGGNAYNLDSGAEITGRTAVGGVVSLCSKFPITENVGLRLRAEDYMYQSALKFRDPAAPVNNFSFDKKFQNDILMSLGLQITLPR